MNAAFTAISRWFDTYAGLKEIDPQTANHIDWVRIVPYIGLHVMCLGVFWVGWSPIALAICGALYVIRMFFVTGFYHRYFSHRTFETSRQAQFVFAVLGGTTVQRGPLWWAGHHRHHHSHSDEEPDSHSPRCRGFLWSHMFWFLSRGNFPTKQRLVKDLAKFPELVFLDRFDILMPFLLGASLFFLGVYLKAYHPGLHTSGGQLLIWGFFVSTILLFHGTWTINSFSHKFGSRRYVTDDDSRNNFLLSVVTLGEGWHNNHHHYPNTVRQGFYWWEFDPTYYGLVVLSWMGIIWNLKQVPKEVRAPDRLSLA